MIILLIIAFVTAAASWYLVKRLTSILRSKQMVDIPNDRTLHQGSIPRGGGLVIVALLALAIVLMGALSGRIAMFAALFVTVGAWAVLSWLDDRLNLSPRRRLLLQIGFAVLMLAAFGWVDVIEVSSHHYVLLPGIGFLLSFIGIIWLANLYNFMDGMDGLAAAQTIIVSTTLSLWFWEYGDQGLAVVCIVLAAASYGFLLWNWHPAKVFMGDVGSVTIGAFFATLILIAVGRYDMPVISFVILLGVFVADASITVSRRLFKREKIWLPHRSHYYQRLAAMGFGHDKIVIGLIVLMTLSSLIATITLVDRDTIAIGALIELVILLCSALFVEFLESRRRDR